MSQKITVTEMTVVKYLLYQCLSAAEYDRSMKSYVDGGNVVFILSTKEKKALEKVIGKL